jgi:lambda family phage portal protein
MGLLATISGFFRGKRKPEPVNRELGNGAARRIKAYYDNYYTTDENQRIWQNVDLLSAKAANNYQVRRVLRIRSRYEVANNSYARGMSLTLANKVIGTGPRLQMRGPDTAANRQVEASFNSWCKAVGFAQKLRTMKLSKFQDGEAFALQITNPRNPHPVQLDFQLIEADQVTTPDPGFVAANWVDGVVLDELGSPVTWHILDKHPGDLYFPMLQPLEYKAFPAARVMQWVRKDRPGWVRGIPETTPALERFATIRRYLTAVLTAAETAADISVLLKSQGAANYDASPPKAWESIPLDRGAMVMLPYGYDATSFRGDQPQTTLDMFVKVNLKEIARCMCMPYCIAAGDNSEENYSSGRMGWQDFYDSVSVERSDCEIAVCDPLFYAYLEEAVMVPGVLPDKMTIVDVPHRWFWPSMPHIDPLKEANADSVHLGNLTTSYADVYAQNGQDWEETFEQIAREQAKMQQLGIQLPAGPGAFQDDEDLDENDDVIDPADEGLDETETQVPGKPASPGGASPFKKPARKGEGVTGSRRPRERRRVAA